MIRVRYFTTNWEIYNLAAYITQGNFAKVKQLISRNNVNKIFYEERGRTFSLLMVAIPDQPEIAKWLIDQGADVDYETNGLTAHDLAVLFNRLGVFEKMEAAGSKLDKSIFDFYKLLIAVNNGNENEVKRLVTGGANFDQVGRLPDGTSATILIHAMRKQQPAIAKWLVEKGAKFNIPDSTGKTAVEVAIEEDRKGVLEKMRATGKLSKEDYDFALLAIATNTLNENEVRNLVAGGANINYVGKLPNGVRTTILQYAIKKQLTLDTVQWLIAKGAKVDITDSTGKTAADVAVEEARPRVLEELHKAGAGLSKFAFNSKMAQILTKLGQHEEAKKLKENSTSEVRKISAKEFNNLEALDKMAKQNREQSKELNTLKDKIEALGALKDYANPSSNNLIHIVSSKPKGIEVPLQCSVLKRTIINAEGEKEEEEYLSDTCQENLKKSLTHHIIGKLGSKAPAECKKNLSESCNTALKKVLRDELTAARVLQQKNGAPEDGSSVKHLSDKLRQAYKELPLTIQDLMDEVCHGNDIIRTEVCKHGSYSFCAGEVSTNAVCEVLS
jgi:ankyrin repeat protein